MHYGINLYMQCDWCIPLYAVDHKCISFLLLFITQANTVQQLGFEMAAMYYMNGEIMTVGTKKGKDYLTSHPAILSTFQAKFLYGKSTITILKVNNRKEGLSDNKKRRNQSHIL